MSYKSKIYLDYNYGYKWISNESSNLYIKGYAFLGKEILQGKDFFSELKKVKDFNTLKGLLKKLNGLFSGIILLKDKVFLFTDKIRTFPLFYFKKDNEIIITDNAFNLLSNTSLDEYRIKEFLATGYVTCEYTLLKDVYQVQAGEIVEINLLTGKIRKEFYYEYLTNFVTKKDIKTLEKEFLQILDNVFLRLIKISNGNQIVIPLSGGYDSRLIAAMLKKLGYENIICFTYGKKDSFEVKIAKKVAEKLGLKWIFVEYNKKTIPKAWYKEKFYKNYSDFAFNFVSLPFIQDFFAFKFLKENNILETNAIIISGHTGDFISGKHIRKLGYHNSTKEIIKEILDIHYSLNKRILDKKIFNICNIIENHFAYSIYENWEMKNRQAKFIVNANRLYEYMGFRHLLPLWDNELVEFFRVLPLELKLNQNFYEKVLLNNIFSRYNIDFRKRKVNKFFSTLKGILRNVVFIQEIYNYLFKAKIDVNNLSLAVEPLQEILKKHKIKHSNNINSVLAAYLITTIEGKLNKI